LYLEREAGSSGDRKAAAGRKATGILRGEPDGQAVDILDPRGGRGGKVNFGGPDGDVSSSSPPSILEVGICRLSSPPDFHRSRTNKKTQNTT
jgi:hypothetical protein